MHGRWSGLLLLFALIVTAFVTVLYFQRTGGAFDEFRVPKFTLLTLEQIPVLRENGMAVEVMADTELEILCHRVAPLPEHGVEHFRFEIQGVVHEQPDCNRLFRLPGVVGDVVVIDVQYVLKSTDGGQTIIDRYTFEALLVPRGPFVRLRGFGTPKNEKIEGLTLPYEVMPYAEAGIALDGKVGEFTALFFVRRPGRSEWLMRVALPTEAGGALRPQSASVRTYRRWGEWTGYALIPEEPIALGLPDDHRELFEVTAAVFRKPDAAALFDRCCASGGSATGGAFAIGGLTDAELKGKAFQGLVARPLSVVRAATEHGVAHSIP